jgi:hypothetical protein
VMIIVILEHQNMNQKKLLVMVCKAGLNG